MPVTLSDLREKRERILDIARQYRATNVRVFGSVVHGDLEPWSDVDLLIDPLPGHSLLDRAGLMVDLRELLHSRAHCACGWPRAARGLRAHAVRPHAAAVPRRPRALGQGAPRRGRRDPHEPTRGLSRARRSERRIPRPVQRSPPRSLRRRASNISEPRPTPNRWHHAGSRFSSGSGYPGTALAACGGGLAAEPLCPRLCSSRPVDRRSGWCGGVTLERSCAVSCCLWGADRAVSYDCTPEHDWWYHHRPRIVDPSWRTF